MRKVTVTTGSRLHFGLITPDQSAARRFGGVGLMIDSPGFKIIVESSSESCVIAPANVRKRCEDFVSRWFDAVSNPQDVKFRIECSQHIPSHGGMGSGTQLALALGHALAKLTNETLSAEEIAMRMQRGKRSAVGIHGFERGGFIVDHGKDAQQSDGDLGELKLRTDWPQDWPIVLVTLDSAAGLSGDAELAAFADIGPMPSIMVEQLEKTLHERLIPGLQSRDYQSFCTALDQYGDTVGDYFAPAQGGRYADHRMRDLVGSLRNRNVIGIAQSSWGPTVCLVASSPDHADQLASYVRSTNFEGEVRVVSALNQGSTIRVEDSSTCSPTLPTK